jgi:outer membrane protein assembly factor BamB
MNLTAIRIAAFWTVLLGWTAASVAADWPQFLGPKRDGSSPETGLLTTWPKEGPKVLWKVEGGDGYSSIAVAGGKAYTLVQRGGDELVVALNVADGKEVWSHRSGPGYKNQYGDGPRSTPTIEGNRVYVQSASGPLLCLDAATGKPVWEVDLLKEFKTQNITWGLSASPLIEDNLVLVLPGAEGGAAAVNKDTGKLAWRTGKDKAAYASPVMVGSGDGRQALFFTAAGLLAVEPKTGQELWRVPWLTEYDVNIATPLVVGNRFFVSSGEAVGCALFQLKGGKPASVWESKGARSVMINYWANSVVQDKHLYGFDGEYNVPSSLRCVDLETGKPAWSRDRLGFANLVLADGHLWITTSKGDLVLAEATPTEYREKGRVKLLEGSRYATVPCIADKKLFVRDRKHIFCLDIAGK